MYRDLAGKMPMVESQRQADIAGSRLRHWTLWFAHASA